ncbi:MAG: NBR1-Ig-like domain-containing protein, partial [Myxococcota bacterium]|nr:NBR1-Ig-like domain-containing protein [Myxococcota bacterium]
DDTGDDDTGDDDTTAAEDDAEVVATVLPTGLDCGELFQASIEMRNNGWASWTRDDGYKLGTVDDEDPLFTDDTRVYLPEGVAVAPGETHLFEFELTAPGGDGVHVTDWQMVREQVHWFGDTAAEDVTVDCPIQTFTDPLTDSTLQPGFDEKHIVGGSFSAAGWQTTGGSDQLRLQLTHPINGDGHLEIDVDNFDPHTQYSGDKHQIINMYTSADGSQGVFQTDEAWWNIRTGNNYYTGFKFLAAPNGGDSREEVRLMESATWDPADSHTFRGEWDALEIHLYLDGNYLTTLGYEDRVQPLQYVFVGKDNVYQGQVGPIYSNLRVTYEP